MPRDASRQFRTPAIRDDESKNSASCSSLFATDNGCTLPSTRDTVHSFAPLDCFYSRGDQICSLLHVCSSPLELYPQQGLYMQFNSSELLILSSPLGLLLSGGLRKLREAVCCCVHILLVLTPLGLHIIQQGRHDEPLLFVWNRKPEWFSPLVGESVRGSPLTDSQTSF